MGPRFAGFSEGVTMAGNSGTVTRAVNAIARGTIPSDLDPAVRRVYGELRTMASARLAVDAAATFQPTDLVHEAYLKLFRPDQAPWDSRAHFFGSAARAMQQLLVDASRRRRLRPVLLDGLDGVSGTVSDPGEVSDLVDALHAEEPTIGEVARLKLFGGLSVDRIAETLERSPSTVKRHWAFARAWIFWQIIGGRPTG
jgi:RNA polymerase sigma factor (TIGR02999 family)